MASLHMCIYQFSTLGIQLSVYMYVDLSSFCLSGLGFHDFVILGYWFMSGWLGCLLHYCMSVYNYIYIHTYIHVHVHVHACTHTHTLHMYI